MPRFRTQAPVDSLARLVLAAPPAALALSAWTAPSGHAVGKEGRESGEQLDPRGGKVPGAPRACLASLAAQGPWVQLECEVHSGPPEHRDRRVRSSRRIASLNILLVQCHELLWVMVSDI